MAAVIFWGLLLGVYNFSFFSPVFYILHLRALLLQPCFNLWYFVFGYLGIWVFGSRITLEITPIWKDFWKESGNEIIAICYISKENKRYKSHAKKQVILYSPRSNEAIN